MNNYTNNFTGLSVLFRALDDADRGKALALLSSMRYAPHLEAIPDVFAIIPTSATQEQSDNIARGMLSKVASNLTSAGISGDYSEVLATAAPSEMDAATGDSSIRPASSFKVPASPVASTVAFIRHNGGGTVPLELVGIMNGYPTDKDGKYIRITKNSNTGDADIIGDDGVLEGGFLSKVKGLASKALKVGAAIANNPIASAALSIVPGGGAVMKGIQLVNKVASSGLGNVASGVLGKLGGLGSVAGKIAGMAKSATGLSKAAGLASAASTPVGPAVPSNATMGQVLESPNLLETLDKTFGPDKVNDAFLHILAAEGDFVDDVMSGRVLSGPSAYNPGVADLAEGDWTDNVNNMLRATSDSFQQYAAKTKAAGASAYSKLDPKLQQFLNDNWGKIAAGTGAVAASAALYAGASKVMKDKEAQARMRVLQAKLDASRAAEAKQKERLAQAASRKTAAATKTKGTSSAPEARSLDTGGAILPPIDTTTNPASFGSPVADVSPGTLDVTAKYIKVPFAGTVMTDLEGEGAKLLKDMRSALLSVNPGFLSGDMPNMSYDSFGATFITHGFPISSVSVIYSGDIPLLNEEKSLGMKITSPYLTRRIIEAALKVTDPRNSNDEIMVRDSNGSFIPFTSIPQLLSPGVVEKAMTPRYLRHMPRALQAEARAGIADKNALASSANAIDKI